MARNSSGLQPRRDESPDDWNWISWAPFAVLLALAVFVPITFSRWTGSSFLLPKETVSSLLAMLLLLAWYAAWSFRLAPGVCRHPFDLPLGVCVSIAAISILFTTSGYLSAMAFFRFFLFAAIFKGVASLAADRSRAHILALTVVLVIGATSVIGILEAFEVRWMIWSESKGRLGIISTYGNPNYVAGTMIAALPMAISLAFRHILDGSKVLGGLTALAAGLMGFLVFLTQTRGSWLGLFFAMVTLSSLWRARSEGASRAWVVKPMAAGLLVVLICLSLAFGVMPGRDTLYKAASTYLRPETPVIGPVVSFFSLDYRRIFKTQNFRQRALVWHGTMRMVGDHPILGIGFGAFKYNYLIYQGKVTSDPRFSEYSRLTGRANQTHNEYLQIWAETGTLGFAAFLWLCATFLIHCFSRISKVAAPNALPEVSESPALLDHAILSGALASVCGVMVHAFVSFPFHLAATSTVFVIFAGLAASAGKNHQFLPVNGPGSSCPDPAGTFGPFNSVTMVSGPTAFFMAVGVFIFFAWIAVKPIIASYYNKMGMEYTLVATKLLSTGDKAEGKTRMAMAIDSYREALKYDSLDGETHAGLGAAYARSGDLLQAVASFERAKENFDSREMYNDMGNVFVELARLVEGDRKTAAKYMESAVAQYRAAIYRDINFDVAYSNLGTALSKLGNYREAVLALKSAVELRGNNAGGPLLFNLGLALRNSGILTDAVTVFERSFNVAPGREAATSIAEIHAVRGRLDLAEDWARRAVETKGGDSAGLARIYHRIGTGLGKEGNTDQAIEYLLKAMELDPKFVNSYIDLGVAYGKAGQMEKSLDALLKSLTVDPRHPSALNNIAMAYLKMANAAIEENDGDRAVKYHVFARKYLRDSLKYDAEHFHTDSTRAYLERVDDRLGKLGILKTIESMGEDEFIRREAWK